MKAVWIAIGCVFIGLQSGPGDRCDLLLLALLPALLIVLYSGCPGGKWMYVWYRTCTLGPDARAAPVLWFDLEMEDLTSVLTRSPFCLSWACPTK